MADVIADAVTSLDAIRASHLSQTVTYRRGVLTVSMSATVGRTFFEVEDSAGAIVRSHTRDYIFAAAALVLGGNQVEPQVGDEIVEGSRVYDIMQPAAEAAWDYCDPQRTMIRVHTKLTESS